MLQISLKSEATYQLILSAACYIVFSIHIILLLLWTVALFKNSIRLRKKVKYTTLAICNQDTRMDALNNKVEYRKSLFMFTIVVCELVSSLFTIISSIEAISSSYRAFIHNGSKNETTDAIINELTELPCNNSEHYNRMHYNDTEISLFRLLGVAYGIPFILTFSLVYTLMSYYVMVTKKSLKYSASLESVDLAREQKVLLLVSSVVCVILLVLLVRVEVFIIFQIVESIITLFQSYVTCKYSRKLIQVLNWKKLDTRIAFGTDNYQYKLYIKTLKSLKTFLVLYNIVVITICLHVIVHCLLTLMRLINPFEQFGIFGVCLPFHLSPQFLNINWYFTDAETNIMKIPLAISFVILFFLNLWSIPYLLSKMSLSCHCSWRCLNLKRNKNLTTPLL